MATDSAAAAGGRADITFGVELVVLWDALEAVVDLHSDGVMDLETVPDVIGLTDVRSVRTLVPDSRGLESPRDMVLRHMVWLQQDLDTMRAEAKKRFRNARPGKCSY